MARIRKFAAYQNIKRPYTRISKFNKLNYVRGGYPHSKLTKFEMGEPTKEFDTILYLKSEKAINIRHNALESARMSSNRLLEKTMGTKGYFLKVKVFPFQVLREHALATGAGADRMSTGMARPYGKAVSSAARIRAGQTIMELRIGKDNLKTARDALSRAAMKLPCACKVTVA